MTETAETDYPRTMFDGELSDDVEQFAPGINGLSYEISRNIKEFVGGSVLPTARVNAEGYVDGPEQARLMELSLQVEEAVLRGITLYLWRGWDAMAEAVLRRKAH